MNNDIELPPIVQLLLFAAFVLAYYMQIRAKLADTVNSEEKWTFYTALFLIFVVYISICGTFVVKFLLNRNMRFFNSLFMHNVSIARGQENIIQSILYTSLSAVAVAELIAEFCLVKQQNAVYKKLSDKISIGSFQLSYGIVLGLMAFVILAAFLILIKYLFPSGFTGSIFIAVASTFLCLLIIKSILPWPQDDASPKSSHVLGVKESIRIKWFFGILMFLFLTFAYFYLNAKYLVDAIYERHVNFFFFSLLAIAFNLSILASIYLILPVEGKYYQGDIHWENDVPPLNKIDKMVLRVAQRERSLATPVVITILLVCIFSFCYSIEWEELYPDKLKSALVELEEAKFEVAKAHFDEFLRAYLKSPSMLRKLEF